MAPKSKKPVTNTITLPGSPETTTMESEAMLRLICKRCAAEPKRGVPTLIGPTQYGKTHFVYNLAREMDKTLVVINPQNDLPEDLAGWPMREGKVLRFTQPSAIPPEFLENGRTDWMMFVDELDKARQETMSTMLTFFSTDERRLRHTRIPDGVPIIAAMNEPNGHTLPDPLLARMLFLAYPPQGLRVWERPDLKPVENLARTLFGKVPDIAFPARPSAPGSLHKLVMWIPDTEFWTVHELRKIIVRGLFNEKDAAVVMTSLEEQPPMRSAEEWATHVTPIAFAAQAFQVFSNMNYEDGEKMLKILVDRTNADATKELERVFRVFAENADVMRGVNRKELAADAEAKLAELYRSELPKILGDKAPKA